MDAGLVATFCSSDLDRFHRRRVAHDPVDAPFLRLAGPQRPDLAAQPRGLERLLNEQDHLIEIEGLVRVVVGPLLHDLDRRVDACVGGQQDDERVGIVGLDLLEQRETVGIGQFVVEQHEVDRIPESLEGLATVCRFDHPIALLGEPFGERPSDQGFVVDDQNARSEHAVPVV